MRIGIPRETKTDEFRVAVTPDKVDALTRDGHTVVVERNAGAEAGFPDEQFRRAGATVASSADEVFGQADLIVKVKEPQAQEYELLRPGQALFTYLHLAASRELTQALLRRSVTSIAYETVQLADGSLPLLAPMSEIAGRLAPQIAAFHLQHAHGGPGKLLGRVAGTRPTKVVVIGGGMVGANAARVASAMGAHVVLMDINMARLRSLADTLDGSVHTLYSTPASVTEEVTTADVVIAAVLVPGAVAPRVVTREMVAQMPPGSLIVDVAIDQGGSVEGIRPTTHTQPTYAVGGVLHYAVPNIPSTVAHTASYALSHTIFPYLRQLAARGVEQALRDDPALAAGLNTYHGRVTHPAVAQALGLPLAPLSELLDGRG